jgi:hypothetical protein
MRTRNSHDGNIFSPPSYAPCSSWALSCAHANNIATGCVGGLAKPVVVDIDANNGRNPQACAVYAHDIFDHLHEVEVRGAAAAAA